MGITAPSAPALPGARGPLSQALTALLLGAPDAPRAAELCPQGGPESAPGADPFGADPWGDDHQLALYLCYELHYRGFAGVDPRWEWDPQLLGLRRQLEDAFLASLRERLGPVPGLAEQLDALLVEPPTGTGPSYHLLEQGERWQAREYLAQRSLYHLKEADPQAWVIPRLHGDAQAALVAIEYDEYGGGRPERVHARLFAEMMADLGLDPGYGRYLDASPAPALAVVNLMSLFGLHRAHRGALVGQFAAVEITSSPGSERLASALERLGAGPAGVRFYQEHVEADAVHEQLVRHGVIEALLRDEPALEADIAFGLAASGLVDDLFAEHLLGSWRSGRSSLRVPLADAPGAEVAAGGVGAGVR
ncbi:iron-containing redox enzyme family protein [Streptacidiphilus sp. PB12-B1b]|uniref:iron-containing redox enzyme family protein n=1 Tax=Streptacidiphilus sp. PB12-B1b TaxID=2705012 RepID=UPI0015FC306C|nr:iron-containing redox enzyme family protein [Streptacidiphilus sp. PB12-B1b]QMU76712.1 iron-containing redox enzyme family protein [Streptacidiphilus sp. PB12-B1b]